jgi:FkbM family methyltransferase
MQTARALAKKFLPQDFKGALRRVILGYESFAPSFSSAGEDMILRHLVGSEKRGGFYVDVGAYHPVRSSNTFFFYLQDWRGINVEARPGSKALFDRMRPRDTNLEVGVSTRAGELTYYVIGDDSTMNSFDRDFLEHIGMLGEVKREIPVPVRPLSDLLAEHLPKGQHIDFMNVDVEGHDIEVLSSNDWNRFRPRFVVVEDDEIDAEKSEVVRLLRAEGYELCVRNVIILDKLNSYVFIDRR